MTKTLSRIEEGSSVDGSTRNNSSKYYSNFKYQLNNCIDFEDLFVQIILEELLREHGRCGVGGGQRRRTAAGRLRP